MSFHLYADDSDLYTVFRYNDDLDQDRAIHCIQICIADVQKWLAYNRLKLNANKTELVIFHPKHLLPPKSSAVTIVDVTSLHQLML